jgi:tetratricopeptide (TPR) repeat protein
MRFLPVSSLFVAMSALVAQAQDPAPSDPTPAEQPHKSPTSPAGNAGKSQKNEVDEYRQAISDHLSVVRMQMFDPAFPLARRETIASETLAFLRSQVAEAPNPEEALAVWATLIDLAREFTETHPNHPMADRFRLTQAEGWWQRSRLIGRVARAEGIKPGSPDPGHDDRAKALEMFESMTKSNGPANDQYSQTARYLLAQCLADQLLVNPKMAPEDARAIQERILNLTEKMDAESISDWARLMRSRALADLDRNDEAQKEIDAVNEAFRHQFTAPWADARVRVLIKSDKWKQADEFLKSADLPTPALVKLRMDVWTDRITHRMTAEERAEATAAMFDVARVAVGREDPACDEALRKLSHSDIEPLDESPVEDWSNLATAHMRAGRTDKAAEALDNATSRETDPKKKVALTYQAGAAWLTSGKPGLCQQRMKSVLESPDSGKLGPRAGLIRVMALGRMGPSGQPMLEDAIKNHLERFPDDSITTGEVRWIEAETARNSGDMDRARIALEAIPQAHPRWMAAQLSMFRASLERLEELVLVADNKTFTKEWDIARKRLERARDSGLPADDKATIELAIARMDLTPGADRHEAARTLCNKLLPILTRDSQRQWAQSLLILADALIGRKLDLRERLAGRDRTMDVSLILDMCRVLDTSAYIIDSEATRRHLGAAMASVAESLPPAGPEFSDEVNQELELRKIRGLIYAGNPTSAEARMDAWLTANPDVKPGLLYGVADALLRLNATQKAIDYLSKWVTQVPEGTPSWFLGRLELAKALYREGHDKQSKQLVEATLLLYPEAGGQGMRRKFDTLRRSLGK